MKVLVTGAHGMLGTEVVAACEAAGDEVAAAGRDRLDVTDRAMVLGALGDTRPDVVIHCAAWTAVDACEADPGRAYAANALAVRHVAEACRRVGAHLVAVSTDYVFDGTKDGPYLEWDQPSPRSVYGASKLAGEQEALAAGCGAAVVRTSWVCGEHGGNMVKTVLRLAASHDRLAFVDDQRGQPTFTADLAPMLRRLAVDRRPGLFHATNAGAVSWFEFVREVMAAAGLDPGRVDPISSTDLQPPRPAPRPANSVLANDALRLSGIEPLRDFHAPLQDLVDRLGG